MLPLAMLMIIINTCRIPHPKWLTAILVLISLSAFLLAASGGYSDLYYKEVSVIEINGVCCLEKVYGPLHFLYTVYLFSYFGMMIAAIAYASIKKSISSCKYVIFLASAVFGNLVIWFVEQLIYVNFEFLSVSYIATELLLLSVHSMVQEFSFPAVTDTAPLNDPSGENDPHTLPPDVEALFTSFSQRAANLTAAERSILQFYADGREISEVAELAFISIHTVRKHNANIYQKLEVGSRDELMLYLDLFRRSNRLSEILHTPEKAIIQN
jgi:DNA-binding CsgD family transcriptional regulator